ncbi:cytoplasmic protein [Nocardia sp. NPDC006044]|uniref:cytoplasmic protein n=1 Tax=Nocardia sp. NPDC006044 TaxID=3364306 RepID=UPI003698636A
MSTDPTVVNPDLYRVIFENERVRVLEYRDRPGDRTQPHDHPDSVLYPLTSFRRRITANGQQVEVALTQGQVRWVGAQEHSGENIGDTETHALFIELKESPSEPTDSVLGPSSA